MDLEPFPVRVPTVTSTVQQTITIDKNSQAVQMLREPYS